LARTVLLADDSVTAQNMGRRILTDAGYEVITVNNGSAALKKIHENQPDLIVLDVYMPGYGGLEVCQRLKESDATNRIPVLLTVGKMEPFKTDEAKRVRADGHIIKPFDASELLAALTRLEDRIVPQSEGVRGRSKSESKKSRRLKGEEIVADEGDELRNDRISYLEEVKRRHARPSETAAQPAATNASLTGIERQARMAASDTGENQAEDAVTFASGPIPAPSAWPASPQNTAPEFPIEKDPVTEPTKVEEASVSSENERPEPAPAAEAVSDSLSGSKIEAAAEPPATEAEIAAEKTESGPRWVAENVALSAEEAVRSLDEEMRQAQTTSEAIPEQEKKESIAAESQERAEDDQTANQPQIDDEISGAAFAATASASGSSSQAVSGSATSETPAPAETAASLDNWERVRETVVGQQVAEAIAQSVASMAEKNASVRNELPGEDETNSPSQAAQGDKATKPAGGDPLSSIVDNVLAELKPRLLAEIAKQLASDKK